jgi:hypothetical protein
VRGNTASGAARSDIVLVGSRRGTAMNRIGQVLDGIVCEIAAMVWLVRTGGER